MAFLGPGANAVEFAIRAIDQASDEIRRIEQSAEDLGSRRTWDPVERNATRALDAIGDAARRNLREATVHSQRLALALGGLTAATTAAGLAAVRLAGQYEQSEIAFETLLGSAERAMTFLEDLAAFAARTPFNFRGLQESSQLLTAFGFEAERIIPITSILGDTVSALGGSTPLLQQVVRAIGQIQTRGRVSAEELLQLAEAGIPAYQILAEQLNLTGEEVARIGELGISASEGINALLIGLAERFGGAMERQAETTLGLFSNVQDQVELIAIEIGEDLIEIFQLDTALTTAIEALNDFRLQVESIGLVGLFEQHERAIQLVAGAIAGALVPALIALIPLIRRVVLAMGPWVAAGVLVAEVLNALGIGIDDIIRVLFNLDTAWQISRVALELWASRVELALAQALLSVDDFSANLLGGFTALGADIGGAVAPIINTVDRITSAARAAINALDRIVNPFSNRRTISPEAEAEFLRELEEAEESGERFQFPSRLNPFRRRDEDERRNQAPSSILIAGGSLFGPNQELLLDTLDRGATSVGATTDTLVEAVLAFEAEAIRIQARLEDLQRSLDESEGLLENEDLDLLRRLAGEAAINLMADSLEGIDRGLQQIGGGFEGSGGEGAEQTARTLANLLGVWTIRRVRSILTVADAISPGLIDEAGAERIISTLRIPFGIGGAVVGAGARGVVGAVETGAPAPTVVGEGVAGPLNTLLEEGVPLPDPSLLQDVLDLLTALSAAQDEVTVILARAGAQAVGAAIDPVLSASAAIDEAFFSASETVSEILRSALEAISVENIPGYLTELSRLAQVGGVEAVQAFGTFLQNTVEQVTSGPEAQSFLDRLRGLFDVPDIFAPDFDPNRPRTQVLGTSTEQIVSLGGGPEIVDPRRGILSRGARAGLEGFVAAQQDRIAGLEAELAALVGSFGQRQAAEGGAAGGPDIQEVLQAALDQSAGLVAGINEAGGQIGRLGEEADPLAAAFQAIRQTIEGSRLQFELGENTLEAYVGILEAQLGPLQALREAYAEAGDTEAWLRATRALLSLTNTLEGLQVQAQEAIQEAAEARARAVAAPRFRLFDEPGGEDVGAPFGRRVGGPLGQLLRELEATRSVAAAAAPRIDLFEAGQEGDLGAPFGRLIRGTLAALVDELSRDASTARAAAPRIQLFEAGQEGDLGAPFGRLIGGMLATLIEDLEADASIARAAAPRLQLFEAGQEADLGAPFGRLISNALATLVDELAADASIARAAAPRIQLFEAGQEGDLGAPFGRLIGGMLQVLVERLEADASIAQAAAPRITLFEAGQEGDLGAPFGRLVSGMLAALVEDLAADASIAQAAAPRIQLFEAGQEADLGAPFGRLVSGILAALVEDLEADASIARAAAPRVQLFEAGQEGDLGAPFGRLISGMLQTLVDELAADASVARAAAPRVQLFEAGQEEDLGAPFGRLISNMLADLVEDLAADASIAQAAAPRIQLFEAGQEADLGAPFGRLVSGMLQFLVDDLAADASVARAAAPRINLFEADQEGDLGAPFGRLVSGMLAELIDELAADASVARAAAPRIRLFESDQEADLGAPFGRLVSGTLATLVEELAADASIARAAAARITLFEADQESDLGAPFGRLIRGTLAALVEQLAADASVARAAAPRINLFEADQEGDLGAPFGRLIRGTLSALVEQLAADRSIAAAAAPRIQLFEAGQEADLGAPFGRLVGGVLAALIERLEADASIAQAAAARFEIIDELGGQNLETSFNRLIGGTSEVYENLIERLEADASIARAAAARFEIIDEEGGQLGEAFGRGNLGAGDVRGRQERALRRLFPQEFASLAARQGAGGFARLFDEAGGQDVGAVGLTTRQVEALLTHFERLVDQAELLRLTNELGLEPLEDYREALIRARDEALRMAETIGLGTEEGRQLLETAIQFGEEIDRINAGPLEGTIQTLEGIGQIFGGLGIGGGGELNNQISQVFSGITTTVQGLATATEVGPQSFLGNLAQGLGRVSPLVGAFINVLGDLSNGAAQVTRQLDQVAASSRLLSRELVAGLRQIPGVTERVSRGGILGLFGLTKEALNEEVFGLVRGIAEGIANGLAQTFNQAVGIFFAGDDDWRESLRTGLEQSFGASIREALVASLVQNEELQRGIVRVTDSLSRNEFNQASIRLLRLGETFDRITEDFGETLDNLSPEAQRVLEGVGQAGGLAGAISGGLEGAVSQGVDAFLAGEGDWRQRLIRGLELAFSSAIEQAVIQGAVAAAGLEDVIDAVVDDISAGQLDRAAERVVEARDRFAGIADEVAEFFGNLPGGTRRIFQPISPQGRGSTSPGGDLSQGLLRFQGGGGSVISDYRSLLGSTGRISGLSGLERGTNIGSITIRVDGAGDPDAVAERVLDKITRRTNVDLRRGNT